MALGTTDSDVPSADPVYGSRRARIDAERAVARRERPRRRSRPTRRPLDLRRALATGGAAFAALALVAVVALPAMTLPTEPSAASAQGSAHLTAESLQRVDVSSGAAAAPTTRDDDVTVALPEEPLSRAASYGDVHVLDNGQLADQPWSLPTHGHITDGFGPRPDRPVAGVGAYHEGTDIATACGTPIYAATRGTVIQAGRNGTYGNWILLVHGDGIQTGYAHIVDGGIMVSIGQTVDAGTQIAKVGATGAATGCHLHFEVRIDDQAVDAVPFMAKRGIILGAG